MKIMFAKTGKEIGGTFGRVFPISYRDDDGNEVVLRLKEEDIVIVLRPEKETQCPTETR